MIIFQLQINLNYNCTDWELTKLIDIKRQEYANNRNEVSHYQRFHLTNHKIKWDHFEILATGRSDMHCKIKESLLIRDLKAKEFLRY